ncbi:HAMP domain-containing sensor histidine kinase [Aeromicrobium sp.]|uniref:sensor histidine kinase n=1 Tax=Aeromicrobium sp. TaxID=1871063 RepID=UPI0028AEE355|nr:HAMP domain-containing sensor histidine kinase [Aeromicrobium sp.]
MARRRTEPTGANSPRAQSGFAARLMGAHALVLVSSALTAWAVASLVAPGIFHDHLQRIGVEHTSAETDHVEQAFASALLISLSVALVTAFLVAFAVSYYLSRRVRRSIAPVTAAASEVATGKYGTRVPDPRLGGEFATLAATFNSLAGRLDAVETSRRRMLSDLAHEMRTPLAIIDAHLEAVEDGVRNLDDSTIDTLRRSTRRLHRLAEDVSALSSAEEGRLQITMRPIVAATLAERTVAAAAEQHAAAGVRFATRLDTDATILADAERIGQVLSNLLDNAVRHAAASGTISVSCSQQGSWIEYTVADDGDGIDAAHLPHIFDRFYRADTARDRGHGGSGIGLSIAKSLTEAHGGELTVDSPGPGLGATFVVRLPVVP